ncbi:hypothetical protein SLS56_011822, partial [Neofusicoccum ribis]
MGSWDCYCAICGSTISGATISEKPRTARFHKRRAEERREAAAAAAGQDAPVNEESDEDSDDNESLDSYDEEYSYDPAILSDEDIEWTSSLHILGFNPDANNITNYRTDGSGAPPVFPFHWCCFELLLKVLTNTTDLDRLDKELLYNVMQDLAQDDTRCLSLDYGGAGAAQSQFWESLPGQEFLVVKPAFVPLLADILPVAIGGETFKNSPQAETPANLEARIANDPFTNMPYDILYKILCFLSFDSISNLSIASWPVHVSLRNNGGFWRQLARNSMPWFFELHGLMEDEKLMEGRNFHKLYLWLEKMTRPKPWVNESFMAVANRRRIWGVCEQLAGLYHTRMSKRANREEFGEVPLVIYPQPTANTETVSTQWVRSMEELDSGVALFHAFWNDDGSLTGLSMSLSGGSQRLFGRDNAVEGVPKHTVTIKSLPEFKGLILHLKPMQIQKRGAETFIVGIT